MRLEHGVLVHDGQTPIFFYQRATKSLRGEFPRSNYIHPLYDLDGNVLTEDFPEDHLHHRGLFWTWHQTRVDGRNAGDAWVCRDFQWDVRKVEWHSGDDGVLTLSTDVHWLSPSVTDERGRLTPIARERASIRVHPASNQARMIDFAISIQALVSDLKLGGSEDTKGYGGFSLRLRLSPQTSFQAAAGPVKPQTNSIAAGRWLDFVTPQASRVSGVALLTHPSLPVFPPSWILRRQRSMQNVVYPGRTATSVPTTKPLTLRYRMVIHRGTTNAKTVAQWQNSYERLK